jgi:hypothetical protein
LKLLRKNEIAPIISNCFEKFKLLQKYEIA